MRNTNRKIKNNRLKRKTLKSPILLAVISLIMIVGITLAFQYFEGGERKNLDLAVLKVDSTIEYTGDLSGVLSGQTIVTSSSFKKAENAVPCYVRAQLEFGSTEESLTREQKNYILALNATDFTSNISTGVDGVSWLSTGDNYYYLVDSNNELLIVNDDTTYNFANNIILPTLLDVMEEGLDVDKEVSNFYLDLKFQAIQTKYLPSNEFEGIVDVFNIVFRTQEKDEYLVRFDTNSLANITPQIVSKGGVVSQPVEPTADGYRFINWCGDSQCQIEYDFNTKIYKNTTIYGNFIDGYIVTMMDKDNTSVYSQNKVSFGGVVTDPEFTDSISADGTTIAYFEGWYSDSEYQNEYEFGSEVTDDLTLYPKMTLVSSDLSFILNSDNQSYAVANGTCTDSVIVLPEYYLGKPVTTIYTSGFSSNSLLTDIELPQTITTISKEAFYNCSNLQGIDLSNVSTSIGDWAFYNTAIQSVVLSNDLTTINTYAFYKCSSITSLTIGDNITTINKNAFADCTGLTSINFNATNMNDLSSQNGVFNNAGIYGDGIVLTIGNNVTKIPAYFFNPYNNSYLPNLKTITFEANSICTTISTFAFRNCENLVSVEIPSSVTSIGRVAFDNCVSLEEIKFNATNLADLTFGTTAFDGCGLDSDGIVVTVGANVKKIPNYLFYERIPYYVNIKSVIFEEGSLCESIGSQAFFGCKYLQSIEIPSKVTTLGVQAFYNCTGLTKFDYNATSLSDLKSNGSSLFHHIGMDGEGVDFSIGANVQRIPAYLFYCTDTDYDVNIKTLTFESGSNCTEIGDYAFFKTTQSSLVIPETVTTIGKNAFRASKIESIILPSSLEVLSEGLFSLCKELKTVDIPSTVTTICKDAFTLCEQLTELEIPEKVTTFESTSIIYCYNLSKITYRAVSLADYSSNYSPIRDDVGLDCGGYELVIGNKVQRIPAYLNTGSSFVKKVTFEEVSTCKEIASHAFNSNILITITVPSSVETVSSSAFSYCEKLMEIVNLSSVTINNQYAITSIEDSKIEINEDGLIFYNGGSSRTYLVGCDNSVKELTLPTRFNGNTYSIYKYAFCQSMITSIVIPNGITTIGQYAFHNASKLKSVTLPNTLTVLESYMFYDCKALETVVIQEGVTTLRRWSFKGCNSLKSLTIPSTVTTIESEFLSDCYSLETLVVADGNSVYTDGDNNCNAVIEIATNTLVLGCNSTIIPSSVVTIASYAFYGSGINSITIPSSVKTINNNAFAYSKVVNVEIEGVETIGNSAFYGCSLLSSVKLPSTLTTIGDTVFYMAYELKSIKIPDSLTTMGRNNFAYGIYCLTNNTTTAAVLADAGVYTSDIFVLDTTTDLSGAYFSSYDYGEVNATAYVNGVEYARTGEEGNYKYYVQYSA